MIYLDPPYNTEWAGIEGNSIANDKEDIKANKFVYRDKFSRNGWLNMMNERLNLAKDLLNEKGILLVSIDDNEYAYLKVLLDSVFGESNFICSFIWQRRSPGGDAKYHNNFVKNLTEYVLLYGKNVNELKINYKDQKVDDNRYPHSDEYVERRGKHNKNHLDISSLGYRPNQDYPLEINGQVFYPGSYESYLKRKSGLINPNDWCWRWSKPTVMKALENGYIEVINDRVWFKRYQFVDNNDNKISRNEMFTNLDLNTIESNLILNIHNTVGTRTLKQVLNNRQVFLFPKPVELIMFLINLHPNKNARILDFFAGSGTTGHAVLELNRKDNGNRSYTLVTNNENNIAYNANYERLYSINFGKLTDNEPSSWVEKNIPYNSNLDVFNVKYASTSLSDSRNIDEIVNNVQKMLLDFGIDKKVEYKQILNRLKSLKKLDDN
ncbi:site-specific DNA-methyltransferase [Mycoplasmopsis synoviae]|uniref:site-specific DNA-methyltransferase n=3 Tax=Mycoplasmopsis synoviae TaxID=2109 RepID=UPI001CD8C3C3|nr:site-specific DNA-methyltransferase [Mycoplasmopsis synoviae]UBM43965.1 site-specific DNA-methyltransferase [Mycoplasmopsis synoviae]